MGAREALLFNIYNSCVHHILRQFVMALQYLWFNRRDYPASNDLPVRLTVREVAIEPH
jgi:hypothetical protein